MKLSEELKYRGFLGQNTFADPRLVDDKKFTLYLGTDPSADSLHVGHLAVYMLARRFLDRGHKVILLVGGGTGQVGDMRDTAERDLLSLEQIAKNKTALAGQISRLFSGQKFELVDNYDWLSKLNLLEFLRDTGKKFNMAELVQREFFKARISNGQLSFAEFTYTLLQGYDFNYLHENRGVNLQLGGSDQWGNILSGVELVRKTSGDEVFGMAAPLVINRATGRKFGKSEGGAVWLDPAKTSPYKFFQFWLNCDDDSAIDYLKLFTLLTPSKIDEIAQKHAQNPAERLAQKTLAREITTLVHGEKTAQNVENVSRILFGERNFVEISDAEIAILAREIPTVFLSDGAKISDVLANSKIAKSRGEARRLIAQNAVSLNGEKVAADAEIREKSLLKKGKNSFALVLEKRENS